MKEEEETADPDRMCGTSCSLTQDKRSKTSVQRNVPRDRRPPIYLRQAPSAGVIERRQETAHSTPWRFLRFNYSGRANLRVNQQEVIEYMEDVLVWSSSGNVGRSVWAC